MLEEQKFHEVIKKLPVAKFFYKGSHSHPVRRTILIINNNAKYICGYELREGSTVRNMKNAPIKSYKKNKIATEMQCRPCKSRQKRPASTYKRMSVLDLLKNNI